MTSQLNKAVLIIGGRGEFGQFLQRDVLPSLGVDHVLRVERDTSVAERSARLRQARHIVLATPLADYNDQASELVRQCQVLDQKVTLWFISSVQASVWRTVVSLLSLQPNPYLGAVFVHPMYGPNGFRAKEREAGTFRNILTALSHGTSHSLGDEVTEISNAFETKLSIFTTTEFDPETHDRATAYSQGLSYCVAQAMFDRPAIDAMVKEQLPDLHHSFHANQKLIGDFLRINTYMPDVVELFWRSWAETRCESYTDLLCSFAAANRALNGEARAAIPTKWYEQLLAAAQTVL
jgi:prephenate dehydrogenase